MLHELLSAICAQNIVEVEKLLDQISEQELNKINDLGRTALHFAAAYGHEKIVKILLPKMCFQAINACNKEKKTALYYAVRNDYEKIADMLIQSMSLEAINASCETVRTSLSFALVKNIQIVKLLIKIGCNVDNMKVDSESEHIKNIINIAKIADRIYQFQVLTPKLIQLKEDNEICEIFSSRFKNKLLTYGLPSYCKTIIDYKQNIIKFYCKDIPYNLFAKITNEEGTGTLDGWEQDFIDKSSAIEAQLLFFERKINIPISLQELNKFYKYTEAPALYDFYYKNLSSKKPGEYFIDKLSENSKAFINFIKNNYNLVLDIHDLNKKFYLNHELMFKIKDQLLEYEKIFLNVNQALSENVYQEQQSGADNMNNLADVFVSPELLGSCNEK